MKHIISNLLSFVLVVFSLSNSCSAQDNIQKSEFDKIAEKIITVCNADSSAWKRLAYFCDMFGHRLSGSENLNNALQWACSQMKREGFDSVWLEPVKVPHWVRGREYCHMDSPYKKDFPILGLSHCAATPKEGITAKTVVVKSFDELQRRASEIPGKIVVFNEPYENYGQAVEYRFVGGQRAAHLGAVAALVRSVTPMSMNNPHAGSMISAYNDTAANIPFAAITEEDAMFFERMQDYGSPVELTLHMESKVLPDADSYNLIAEIRGTEKPSEVVAFGGHSDCWDVGSGAQDDASGCIAAWQVLTVLKKLGIRPKRTMRAVFWVNEENGSRGGKAYAAAHGKEPHALVYELDSGIFPPDALRYHGSDSVLSLLGKELLPYLQKVEKNIELKSGGGGVDIGPMMELGVPAMSLHFAPGNNYFWYHHAATDTPDKVDPKDLNKCITVMALALYFYAEMP